MSVISLGLRTAIGQMSKIYTQIKFTGANRIYLSTFHRSVKLELNLLSM
jgi:hypothetical protein